MEQKRTLIKRYGEYQIVAENERLGVIKGLSDDWLIEPEFNYVDYFVDEKRFMCIKEEEIQEFYSFYDENGKKQDFQYDDLTKAFGFYLGLCVIEDANCLLNIIDINGNRLLPHGVMSIKTPWFQDGKTLVTVFYFTETETKETHFQYINGCLEEIIKK